MDNKTHGIINYNLIILSKEFKGRKYNNWIEWFSFNWLLASEILKVNKWKTNKSTI